MPEELGGWRVLAHEKGFLFGVMKCSKVGHGDSCPTLDILKPTGLYSLNGSIMSCIDSIAVKPFPNKVGHYQDVLKAQNVWLKLVIRGFHCRVIWLSCSAGGASDVGIFVFLLGLVRFPRQDSINRLRLDTGWLPASWEPREGRRLPLNPAG